MLLGLVTARGFNHSMDRVALVGFSQGATMAVDVVASGRWQVRATVGFAGRLCSPEPLRPAIGTMVSVIHGDADPVVPEAEGRRAARALRQHGVRVDRHIVAAQAHAITRDAAEIAARFLDRALQGGHPDRMNGQRKETSASSA
jgi:phospholipase/carboxylesterase